MNLEDLRLGLREQDDDGPFAPLDPDALIQEAGLRRRRRVSAIAMLVAVVVAGAAVATTVSVRAGGESPAVVVPASPGPPAAVPSVTSAPASAPTPSWLPAGAHLSSELPRRGGGVRRLYSLPGPANADNIPFGGATEQNATSIHPATYLEVQVSSHAIGLPLTDDGVDVEHVEVSGHPAQFRLPVTGHYGTLRIDWAANGTFYEVSVDRGRTNDGTSGITPDALLHVAESMRS
jgi:hypothetical protein